MQYIYNTESTKVNARVRTVINRISLLSYSYAYTYRKVYIMKTAPKAARIVMGSRDVR